MINKTTTNPCIRCGKERVILKTWKEKMETYAGVSILVHTETGCPDKSCQKIVLEEYRVRKERNDEAKRLREEKIHRRTATPGKKSKSN